MSNRSHDRKWTCSVCGSESGYVAQVFLMGRGHFDAKGNMAAMNVDSCMITSTEAHACAKCGAPVPAKEVRSAITRRELARPLKA